MSVIALQTLIYKGKRYNLGDEITADTVQENTWVKNGVVRTTNSFVAKLNQLELDRDWLNSAVRIAIEEQSIDKPKQEAELALEVGAKTKAEPIGRKGKV